MRAFSKRTSIGLGIVAKKGEAVPVPADTFKQTSGAAFKQTDGSDFKTT
jgi:hypothetical protein